MPRTWKWLGFGLAAMVTLLGAAACGGDDDGSDGGNTPGATAAATSQATSPADTPTAAASTETEYPLTVTDMLDRSVTIEAEPQAIAAVSPTAIEFVYAVGETSLTRTTSVTYPEEALSATDIGSAYRLSVEVLAGVNADLIIADSVLQPQLAGDLEALGVPVLFVGAETYDDVATGFRLVGEVLNTPEGETKAAELEALRESIESQVPAERVKVVIVNGTPDDFFVALPESYVGDLVSIAGGDNLAAGEPGNAPFPGYTKLSIETIVAEAPEVVLAITAAPGQTLSEALAADAAWSTVPAVENERVHEIDVQVFLQAPGPRAAEGLQELAELLYPETFAQ